MSKAQAIADNPGFPFLNVDDAGGTERILRGLRWLDDHETIVAVTRAGGGNLNLTLRIRTDRRSFIVKQSRPWVEKHDHFAAPWDRCLFEQRFYQRVSKHPRVAARMPRLIASNEDARLLALEDLGDASDFADLYQGKKIALGEIDALADYLSDLHLSTESAGPDSGFINRDMRALNHEHIYRLPLADNGVKLDAFEPGLDAAACELRADRELVAAVHATGTRYLANGPFLLHGDYFPCSWLRTANGPRVIDPEFCYFGDREFDTGVAVAHFAIAGQPRVTAQRFLDRYHATAKRPLQHETLSRYAACEVMRRLIGVTQLPFPPSSGRRIPLLRRAWRAMLGQAWETLFAS